MKTLPKMKKGNPWAKMSEERKEALATVFAEAWLQLPARAPATK